MIVVVEGVSAAGKSTWCQAHYPQQTVSELPPVVPELDSSLDERQHQEFWLRRNKERWRCASDLEATTGLAVCDTDPFKLHYTWGLWRIGRDSVSSWEWAVTAAQKAFQEGSLGLADLILVADVDESDLRLRRNSDSEGTGRRRGTFDLHVLLREPLREWYEAVERVSPGRVRWELPSDGDLSPAPSVRSPRSGAALFHALLSELPAR